MCGINGLVGASGGPLANRLDHYHARVIAASSAKDL